jgi:phosphate transport system substrate-binding protein
MRLLILAAAFLVPMQARAGITDCQPNTIVNITTATLKYYNVAFIGEETSAGAVYWNLKTESGPTSVPKSAILDCEPADRNMQAPAPTAPTPVVQPKPNGSVEIRIHGSNTIGAKLAPELARAYAGKSGLTAADTKILHPEEVDYEYGTAESDRRFLFHFQAHGSATAFQSLLANAADIGMASRRINDKELASLKAAGLGDLTAAKAENVIGLDGVIVIVNPGNPVQSLTLDQLARIFSGEIADWKDVGGSPGPINIYSRDSKSGTFDTFKSLVLEAGKKRELAQSAKRFESSEELSDSVAADPAGIGFIGFAYKRSAKVLAIGTSCGLEFAAEPYLVRTEEYPLARRLYMYVPESRRSEQVDGFMRFVLSADAQPVTAAVGFIGLEVEQSSRNYVLERGQYSRIIGETSSASSPSLMQRFAQRITNAVRLSITFRFKTGSTELDNRSLEDVGRLAAYIQANPGTAERIMLFGFADPKGNFQRNLELSRERAVQIADALAAQGVSLPRGQVQGFGIIAPVACSDSESALEKNRRVEVWLRR